MGDTTEIENQVGNAVDILMDISRDLENLVSETEKIRRKLDDIERRIKN